MGNRLKFDKNLLTRIITGFFIILFIFAISFTNDYVLYLGILFLSNVAIYEMAMALDKIGYKVDKGFVYSANTSIILLGRFLGTDIILPLVFLYVVVLLIYMIFVETSGIESMFANLFILAYITMAYFFIANIDDSKWIFYMFGLAASTDTSAYVVGMIFGRHKLIERLSPKKTVEGAIGGILGGLIFTLIFTLCFKINQAVLLYVFSVLASVLSEIGDLVASFIKRRAGIKDYGSIFIGHGGVMDRFDSLILISPLVYMLLKIL